MFRYIIDLSWKNIWRNRRRTLLTVTAMGLGVMALVFLYNFYDTFHEQLIHNVIRYHSGHLVASAPGYSERNASNLYLREPQAQEAWLAAQPEVEAASPRVRVQGLLSSAQGSANIVFAGIDTQREKRVTQFSSRLSSGEYELAAAGKGILIGKALSELLKVEVGSKVVALTQGIDGSIGNELFRVRGIFETQSDMDKGLAFIDLQDARSLASLPANAVHQISVLLKQELSSEKIKTAFATHFPQVSEILSWKQVQRPVMAIIDLNKGVNHLLMIIILSVSALGIANSILMSLLERTREFGVMMAIGTTKAEVTLMVVTETLLLCLVGVVSGNCLGVLVTKIFGHYGFDLKWFTSNGYSVEGTMIQTISYPLAQWHNTLFITAIIFALALAVAILPARHVARLSAVQAIKSH